MYINYLPRHDIAERLLKLALNTNQSINQSTDNHLNCVMVYKTTSSFVRWWGVDCSSIPSVVKP